MFAPSEWPCPSSFWRGAFSFVFLLIAHRNPSTVLRMVVAININPVYRQMVFVTVRQCPRSESIKGMSPFITNRNAPATVAMKALIFRIIAPAFHTVPNSIKPWLLMLYWFPVSVVSIDFGRNILSFNVRSITAFPLQATAAFCLTCCKLILADNCLFSTITIAKPKSSVIF